MLGVPLQQTSVYNTLSDGSQEVLGQFYLSCLFRIPPVLQSVRKVGAKGSSKSVLEKCAECLPRMSSEGALEKYPMGVYASRFVLLECLRFSSCTYRVSTLLAVRSLSAYASRFDLSVGPTTGFTSELALLQQRKKKGKSVLGKK